MEAINKRSARLRASLVYIVKSKVRKTVGNRPANRGNRSGPGIRTGSSGYRPEAGYGI
jgi:hypothetical protein